MRFGFIWALTVSDCGCAGLELHSQGTIVPWSLFSASSPCDSAGWDWSKEQLMGFASLGRRGSSCPWRGSGLILYPVTAAKVVIQRLWELRRTSLLHSPEPLGSPSCAHGNLWGKLFSLTPGSPSVSDPCV